MNGCDYRNGIFIITIAFHVSYLNLVTVFVAIPAKIMILRKSNNNEIELKRRNRRRSSSSSDSSAW